MKRRLSKLNMRILFVLLAAVMLVSVLVVGSTLAAWQLEEPGSVGSIEVAGAAVQSVTVLKEQKLVTAALAAMEEQPGQTPAESSDAASPPTEGTEGDEESDANNTGTENTGTENTGTENTDLTPTPTPTAAQTSTTVYAQVTNGTASVGEPISLTEAGNYCLCITYSCNTDNSLLKLSLGGNIHYAALPSTVVTDKETNTETVGTTTLYYYFTINQGSVSEANPYAVSATVVWKQADQTPLETLSTTAPVTISQVQAAAQAALAAQTAEETAEASPSPSPEVTATPEPTATPEVTETPEPTATPEVTETPEPTATPEVTETPEPTATPEVTETPEPTATPDAASENGEQSSRNAPVENLNP